MVGTISVESRVASFPDDVNWVRIRREHDPDIAGPFECRRVLQQSCFALHQSQEVCLHRLPLAASLFGKRVADLDGDVSDLQGYRHACTLHVSGLRKIGPGSQEHD